MTRRKCGKSVMVWQHRPAHDEQMRAAIARASRALKRVPTRSLYSVQEGYHAPWRVLMRRVVELVRGGAPAEDVREVHRAFAACVEMELTARERASGVVGRIVPAPRDPSPVARAERAA